MQHLSHTFALMGVSIIVGFLITLALMRYVFHGFTLRPTRPALKVGIASEVFLFAFLLIRMLAVRVTLLENITLFDMTVAYSLGAALATMLVHPGALALHGMLQADEDGGIIVHDPVAKEAKTPAVEAVENVSQKGEHV